MVGRFVRIAAVLVVTALAFIGILNLVEHVLVYHPHPYRANYQRLLSSRVVEMQFKTGAGEQVAFYVPPKIGSGLPNQIWVAFCGNGSLALDWLPLTAHNQNSGSAFLLIDYPGYGKSAGWSNVANTRAAAEGALVALASHLGVEATTLEPRLSAIGHSLGAAAALDFATFHAQVHQIILLAPFTSLREEAAIFIGRHLSYLLRTNYDNRATLRELGQRPTPPRITIFHGLEDGMIPPEMGRELAAEFPRFVTFRGVPEASHDTVAMVAQDEIVRLIADGEKEPRAQ